MRTVIYNISITYIDIYFEKIYQNLYNNYHILSVWHVICQCSLMYYSCYSNYINCVCLNSLNSCNFGMPTSFLDSSACFEALYYFLDLSLLPSIASWFRGTWSYNQGVELCQRMYCGLRRSERKEIIWKFDSLILFVSCNGGCNSTRIRRILHVNYADGCCEREQACMETDPD